MVKTSLILIISTFAAYGCKWENKPDDAGRSTLSENAPNSNDIDGQAPVYPFATAVLVAKSGSAATGTVSFFNLDGALKVVATVEGVTPAGNHGIHVHEFGDCSAPDASSAGGHFNPTQDKHSQPNSRAVHIGDLGNIEVDQNGKGDLTLVLEDAYYDEESIGGWEAVIGKSVVLHEGPDDMRSQPTGNSGARIACGTIKEASTD